MGNRLNWDLANRRARVRRNGSHSVFRDLAPTGSYADRTRYFERSKKRDDAKPQAKATLDLVKCPRCGALVKKLRAHNKKAHAKVDSACDVGKQANANALIPNHDKLTKHAKVDAQVPPKTANARNRNLCPFCGAKASDLHDHIKDKHGSTMLVRWILSR